MPLLEQLADKICDELHDAGSYAQMALDHREDHPELARVLHGISQEEMGHFEKLHAEAEKLIGEIKRKMEAFEA